MVNFSLSGKRKKNTDTYTNIKFIHTASVYISFFFICILFTICYQVLCSGSVNCHGLSHATSETCLAHSGQDLSLSILKHPDDLGEGGADFRIGIPAARHDFTQHRETIIWDNWPYPLVHNSKCCLHCCHVLEGKQTCYELPKDNPKAIHIHLLCIGPVLNHLSVQIGKSNT